MDCLNFLECRAKASVPERLEHTGTLHIILSDRAQNRTGFVELVEIDQQTAQSGFHLIGVGIEP